MIILKSLLANLRAFPSGSDALVSEQYRALRRQVPLMYALMSIDAAFLGFVAFDSVSPALSVGVPAVLVAATVLRALVWVRRGDGKPAPAKARRYLRAAVIIAAVLSITYGGWGVLLLNAVDAQTFSVALYIFVGVISCCISLQALPIAGRLILLFGAAPVTVWLMLSGDLYLFGIGANFAIVAALVARTLSTNHKVFIEVLNSRSEILAEQARVRVAEQKAQQLALHDVLTGLQNRRALSEQLGDLRLGEAAALLVLDLDHFKSVNDVHGHPAGDRLLQSVARRLRGIVETGGTAYRLGGDEFAVIFKTDRGQTAAAIDLAKRIVEELAMPFPVDGLSHHIGASVGLSFFPDDALDSETLMRRADIALYKAKALGRSQFLSFRPAMDAEITRRSHLEREFRRDLARGAFRPWYQPIVDLRSGEVTGFEMLARWHKEDALRVGPDQFIPIAEECGLVGELMLMLLEQSCADALTWGPDLVLSVNVSPTQLKDPSLPGEILTVLAKTGFSPARLRLEITENALISEPDNAKKLVAVLKKEGVSLALDDFGTGFSSIQHLRLLPFDNIKIDRSFILGLEEDEEAYRMVLSMTRLASSLRLPVVAEGIETSKALELVRTIGCAQGQGYLFGRPTDAAGAAALLRRRESRLSGSLAA